MSVIEIANDEIAVYEVEEQNIEWTDNVYLVTVQTIPHYAPVRQDCLRVNIVGDSNFCPVFLADRVEENGNKLVIHDTINDKDYELTVIKKTIEKREA